MLYQEGRVRNWIVCGVIAICMDKIVIFSLYIKAFVNRKGCASTESMITLGNMASCTLMWPAASYAICYVLNGTKIHFSDQKPTLRAACTRQDICEYFGRRCPFIAVLFDRSGHCDLNQICGLIYSFARMCFTERLFAYFLVD
eukprot:359986_1